MAQAGSSSTSVRLLRRAQVLLDSVKTAAPAPPTDPISLDLGAPSAWAAPVDATSSSAISFNGVLSTASVHAPKVLRRLCRRPEGWGPVSRLRDLDFTPCAEDAWLLALPAFVFALFAAADLAVISQLPPRQLSRRSKHLLLAKQIGLVLMTLISIGLSVMAGLSGPLLELSFITPVLQSVAYLLLVPLVSHNHRRMRRASTPALLYLLWHICSIALRLRTHFNTSFDDQRSKHGLQLWDAATGLAITTGVIALLVFSIECAGPAVGGDTVDIKVVAPDESAISANESEFVGVPVPGSGMEKECPENTANIFSRLAFSWMGPMMTLGAKKFLTEDDMWSLPPGEDAEHLGNRFEKYYASLRTKKGKPRFWVSLGAAYGGPYFFAAVLKVAQDCLAFAQPQLLRYLLRFVSTYGKEGGQPASHGFALSVSIFVVAMIQTATLHQYFQRCFTTGMRVRAGLVSVIFKKAMRLSNEDRAGKSTGEVITIMSVDATRLQDLMTYGHIIWSAFFQMALAFISLYELLGWSAFTGVAVMVVSVPLNTLLARYIRSLSTKQMKIRDRRTKFMSEILNNIKSIKLFAWEEAFTAKLDQIRNKEEIKLLRWTGIVNSSFTFVWSVIPFLVSLATFITYSLTQEEPLTADLIFPALALFQLLSFPLAMAAGVLSAALQATVSANRISEFLDAGELDPNARRVELPNSDDPLIPASAEDDSKPLVEIKNGEFKWSREQPVPTLQDINLTVNKGELLAVLGKVGDGKSSLLSAILGEMYRSDGEVVVRGRTAYFVQGGFNMGTSVRENITWGMKFEPDFYQRCVSACALEPDFAVLPDGDATEIGEKGVSLSGGQRARVALARAVYARADVYLLDDPLAAVDAHVGSHIFKHVIGPDGLLKNKARILTTNSVAFLPQVDQIISLRRGICLGERGSYNEVMTQRGEIYNLINGLGKQASRQRERDEEPDEQLPAPDSPPDYDESITQGDAADESLKVARVTRRLSSNSSMMKAPRQLTKGQIKRETVRQLRESSQPKEKSEQGSVSWKVYKEYASSMSMIGVIAYVIAQIAGQFIQIGRDVTLKQWAAHPGQDKFYLTLYAIAGFSGSIIVCIAPFILYAILVPRSARHLHDNMFNAVLRAPLQWFESTPSGRTLNLFSRDTNTVDEVLPRVIGQTIRCAMVTLGVFVVVIYSVPPFALAIIPLVWAYSFIMKYYLATSRELKRLDAVSKSPIFSWFSESLNGLSTIRAFGSQQRFIATSEARVDRNQQCYFPAVTCNRWLACRIEFLGSCLIFCASTLAVYVVTTGGKMDAGLMGLMLSQLLQVTGVLNWTIRSLSEVEQNIVSVERILSYTDTESEAPYTVAEADRPPRGWPSKGSLEFRNYSARYREGLPLVLKKLNISVAPGERIGIVGRTGAGKSSLTLALFRIIEASEGSIFLDGVDCRKIGLKDLRRAIAIIPQDPELWEGTLRDNLDPTHTYDDVQIWRALGQAHLKDYVNSLDGRLDAKLSEGASNMSSGQRQLVVIARALLRQAKILVLDEATSAIDLETDDLIQKVIREEFKGTTLTVAHRLNTVLGADRIVVLKDGEVAEFDSPKKLMADKTTIFFSMCVEAGITKVDDSN